MTRLVVLFALMIASAVHAAEPVTTPITVSVEIVDPAKVCAKAVSILVSRHKITAEAAKEQLLVPGDLTLRPATCLELIYTSTGSPTNGYKVHDVTSRP